MDNTTNDVINIIPDNYIVDLSGINSLDNTQNNDFVTNNGEIVLFQSSDGSLHTISLTPEQMIELGLQVQYPATPLSVSTNEPPYSHGELPELENIVIEAPIHNSNQALSQGVVYNEAPLEVPQDPPLHRVVRVSELATTRGRGFQLITDHMAKYSHSKVSENSLIKPRTNGQPKTNGSSKKSQLFIPTSSSIGSHLISNYPNGGDMKNSSNGSQMKNSSNGNHNSDAVLTGKFILTHNDIGSFKPDTKNHYGNAKSVLLPMKQDNKFSLKTTRLVSVQNPVASSSAVSQKVPPKNVKMRNAIQLKTISPNLKKTLNIKLPLTPIPIVPKPPRKMFMQEDPMRLTRWKPAQPHQTVHVLQSGDQYQSVEKLNGEQLRVVTDALNTVVARPENKGNALYDPSSKTRIVYRVVYPEDLNMFGGAVVGDDSKKPKKDKKPKTVPTPIQTPQVVSVTRSGRHVRLPRHMAMDYERPDEEGAAGGSGSLSLLDGSVPAASTTPSTLEDREDMSEKKLLQYGTPSTPPPTHKKKFTCPLCRKVYRGANRMGRHFLMFADHAITPKATEILVKYKTENQAKEIKPKPVPLKLRDLQTEPIKATNINNGSNPLQSNHTAGSNINEAVKIEDLESKEERSLFTSLVGILERTSEECRAAVFVRQLSALIIKLRRLMPCLLFEDKNNSSCIINDPVGKMLDVSPGKYRLNMEAIKCIGEQGDNCKHVTPKPIPSASSISATPSDTWMSSTEDTLIEKTSQMNDSGRRESLDKWTTNVGKRKWIPIGSQDTGNDHSSTNNQWLSNNSHIMMDNASFSQTVGDLKSWDSTPLQKQSRVSESTPGSPWRANIAELIKLETPEQLPPQRHIIEPSNQPVQSDDSISFDCTSKIADMHSNLVFDMKTQIALDTNSINRKNELSDNGESTCDVAPGNYDFNDSRFDMQIDSDKLNFTSAQYNEMKYGRDALPPFRKIEISKNLQIPLDSLSDMSSDGDKLHLPSGDAILSENSYQMTSESLGLSMENGHMDTMTVDVRKGVPMNSNENGDHCEGQSMLNNSDLNLPTSNADTSSRNELLVSESSLDGGRLNLSSNQSVLHLLDPLGTDCLSFGDSELRPTSQMSLDLQLDLFPFHHS